MINQAWRFRKLHMDSVIFISLIDSADLLKPAHVSSASRRVRYRNESILHV